VGRFWVFYEFGGRFSTYGMYHDDHLEIELYYFCIKMETISIEKKKSEKRDAKKFKQFKRRVVNKSV